MYPHQDLTYRVIAAAIEVHKNLDPGLLEAVYFTCLSFELEDSGLYFEKELDIPLLYKDRITNRFLRLDFLVENKIVLELKSVETVLPVHEAQLLTYLKLTGKQIGLLINFIEYFSKKIFLKIVHVSSPRLNLQGYRCSHRSS